MIWFEQAVIRYPGAPAPAVQGISLAAARGRVTAVVGPNGSGKSTLVRALLGRLSLEGGALLLDGAPLAALDRRAIAKRVAVVTQREEPVFPLSVREYIALGRHPHGGPFAGRSVADRGAIASAIARTDVGAFADENVHRHAE